MTPTRSRDRILIVDDEPLSRTALDRILSSDFEVTLVAGPREAVAQLERCDFLIVITDEEMPGGSGLKLLEEMGRRYPLVLGILVTGHIDYPSVQDAMRNIHGATVILKPFEPEALLRQVQSAATLARVRRSTQRLGTTKANRSL